MADPLISAVVIFLDAERFLGDAVESVFAQTEPRWELLLVDDGSTDGSAAIAEAARARDPERVRVLRHPGGENRGMSASRNLGIAQARGRFVAFLDGDDAWLPGRLAVHLERLAAHPDCALVCGPTRMWFSWASPDGDRALDPLRPLGAAGPQRPPEYLLAVLADEAKTPAICSFTARTEAVRAIGGFDDDFRGMFEDQVFFAKILARAPVLAIEECLDLYRQHPGSACWSARFEGHYHGSPGNPAQRAFIARLREQTGARPEPDPRLLRAIEIWEARFRHPVRTRLGDVLRAPRRTARAALRTAASRLLPARVYRRLWMRAQGFGPEHGGEDR